MRNRFKQSKVRALFDLLENCDECTFLKWLKKLQPSKTWTEKKERYWFLDDEPIRGILAQMLGTMVRNTDVALKRRRIVAKELGLKSIKINDELTPAIKKKLMMKCLRNKFRDNRYRKILDATSGVKIHERPLRGNPNSWSYKPHADPSKRGGDWLGQLLMTVRDTNCRPDYGTVACFGLEHGLGDWL